MATPQRVMLMVPYRGQNKYVGKVFQVPGKESKSGKARWIFLHQESGSQTLYKYDSPGGIDLVALDWMMDHGIHEVHHHRRDQGVTYWVDLDSFRAYPPDKLDGRTRVYMPSIAWQKHQGDPWYHVPYIRAELVLPETARPYQGPPTRPPEPKPEPAVSQGRLF